MQGLSYCVLQQMIHEPPGSKTLSGQWHTWTCGATTLPHASAGCEDPPSSPAEGDVRLVPLNGTAVPTAVCDDVHFGGVELFREGAWGRICPGRKGGEEASFTLDAQVVCRQLGLPFGTVMDTADDNRRGDYSDPLATVWATQVLIWMSPLPV